MGARVPLDVDLEDKLLYGLTPIHLAYVVIAFVSGFAVWSAHWAPEVVRGSVAFLVVGLGAAAAWGRWRGRAADEWAADMALFVLYNHHLEWRWRLKSLLPRPFLRHARAA